MLDVRQLQEFRRKVVLSDLCTVVIWIDLCTVVIWTGLSPSLYLPPFLDDTAIITGQRSLLEYSANETQIRVLVIDGNALPSTGICCFQLDFKKTHFPIHFGTN